MLTFCLGYWSFVVKNLKQKKDTFRIWHGQLKIQVFFHKLVLGKKKDDEGSKQH